MTPEQIIAKLNELYSNNKSKTFLNHLVRSYIPFNRIEKVYDKPKGEFKCVITKEPLISQNEIINIIKTKELDESHIKHLETMLNESKITSHPMTKLINNKLMAVTGQDTNTFMAYSTFIVFYDWVITKVLTEDKHINWLVKDINRRIFLNRAELIATGPMLPALNKIRKGTMMQATFTLGDLGVLQQLKENLEKEEKIS